MDPLNEIIKIDSADEFYAALTKGGNLYVWGKNDRGQLGTGAGIGVDMIESEKYPLLLKSLENVKIIDFYCGENTMLIKDKEGRLYRTGLKVDYIPSLIEITKEIKPKLFVCGNSYYCMISGKFFYFNLKIKNILRINISFLILFLTRFQFISHI